MQKIIDKLEEEYNVLDDKIRKIDYYINTNPEFQKLSASQQNLMITQSKIMDTYSYILEARIEELSLYLPNEIENNN